MKKKIPNTKKLSLERIRNNTKVSKHKLFGSKKNIDLNKDYSPLSWEEIDSIPCIGEDIC